MKFQKGNPGRPKGALKRVNAELATACRDALDSKFWPNVERLLMSKDDRVRLDTMKFLAERGWGRAPETIRLGIDAGSAEAILLQLAKQHRPGQDLESTGEGESQAETSGR